MRSTRRQFLTTAVGSSAVISLGTAVPRFLLAAAAQETSPRNDNVLVVVQLSGGNDGLNTIVPFAEDEYHKSRPQLAISAGDVLKIDDHVGFHPTLQGFSELLEAGQLSIVQGVGYPDPNRSHFESMDIWHTCRRKNQARDDGWLGRYLDLALHQSGGDVPALHLGGEDQPLALAAQDVRVPSISSLQRFRLQGGDNSQLRQTIEQLTGAQRSNDNRLLDFIQTSTTSALAASQRVEQASKDYKTNIDYPDTELAEKLLTVAQLIDAGLSTRIYYVALDGFDTHSRQADAHTVLLRQLSGAVSAFVRDVADHGHGRRVLLMSFSEFGRRVTENASAGTDHGAAAPMFLAGQRVKPGLIGDHPSLTDLVDGDLKFHTDFRQVYAAIMENWLDWPAAPVLGAEYQVVDVLQT
jgi:uncharacterized protein (DUF1501 family)